MNFTAAIDISSFIWSPEDFNNNRHYYYEFIGVIPTVYEQIKLYKTPLLFRNELYELIVSEFPYTMVNTISHDYGRLTMTFLIDTAQNWHLYDELSGASLTVPNIIKPYFNDKIRNEVQFQINHIFYKNQPQHKFITYYNFFKHSDNLKVSKALERDIEIDTVCYNSETDIIQFFDTQKIKFKHNPKHNNYNAKGKVSPLSCYNERFSEDTLKAQQLLDSAVLLGDDYYNYDMANDVYVVFVKTREKEFHGFDLSDEGNNVPNEIKNRFNKDGRRF